MDRRMRWVLAMTVAASALLVGSRQAEAAPTPGAPDTFGTTETSYVSIAPNEFLPADFPTTYNAVYRLTISSGTWITYPHLPSGAILTSIEWDYCDNDGGDSPTFGIFELTRIGNETGTHHILAPAAYLPGCRTVVQDLTGAGLVAKTHENRLIVYTAVASTIELAGAVIGYKLQVSPAPPKATFGDVPTSDPGFQYIEALVASGVTGGCGSGNYCPEAPVTRRQMAIFIAKALGLHWE